MEWNGNVQKYIHTIHGQLTFDKSAKCSSTKIVFPTNVLE